MEIEGQVVKTTGSWHWVQHSKGITSCVMKGKFRTKGLRTTNPVTVGDQVCFIKEENENTGLITTLYPRKNYIIRRSTNLSKEAHLIAANVDQAFLVITIAFPTTLPGFIDRFLVSAEAYKIPVNIVFNKVDLYEEDHLRKLASLKTIYEKIGYNCIEVSALKDINLEALRQQMKGKLNAISGNSGVGKSTLVNALDSNLDLRTGAISDHHSKGKHTTTFSEMFALSFGGAIIDTPGIKSFGLVDMENDQVSHYFPEIFSRSHACKFNNCRHVEEPQCAVIEAVESGEISQSRYDSYRNLLAGDSSKYREDIYG